MASIYLSPKQME